MAQKKRSRLENEWLYTGGGVYLRDRFPGFGMQKFFPTSRRSRIGVEKEERRDTSPLTFRATRPNSASHLDPEIFLTPQKFPRSCSPWNSHPPLCSALGRGSPCFPGRRTASRSEVLTWTLYWAVCRGPCSPVGTEVPCRAVRGMRTAHPGGIGDFCLKAST